MSPENINSFLWPIVLELWQLSEVETGVLIHYTDEDGNVIKKRARVFCLMTMQDLMALLKTTGLAITAGKCLCPYCILSGTRRTGPEDSLSESTKYYLPMNVLPPSCREASPRHEAASVLNRNFLRDFEWLQAKYLEKATSTSKGASDAISINSGVKRATPLWCIPNPLSMPGGFIAFDCMHTIHHNCFNNIIAFCLDSIKTAGFRVILQRAEKVVVPHDIASSYQRLVDLQDMSKKRYKGLKAADKFFLMSYIIPVILCRLLPSRLYWAICAICFCTRLLALGTISTSSLDKIESTLCEACWVLNSYFPANQMKVTIHLLLHAVEWVRKNGPLRYTWLYFFERFNKELTDAVSGNRVPVITVCKTLRLGKFLKFVLDDAIAASVATTTASAGTQDSESLRLFETLLSREVRAGVKYDRYENGKYTFPAVGLKSRLHAKMNAVNVALAAVRSKRGRVSSADERLLNAFADGDANVTKIYATLFNTAFSQEEDPHRVDIFDADFSNTSQVYHSVAYHLKGGQSVINPTKLGAYNLSCFVRVKYQYVPEHDDSSSESGESDVEQPEERTGIAIVLYYCIARGIDDVDRPLAKVHFLDECELNMALSSTANNSVRGFSKASAFYQMIPTVDDKNLERHCNECNSTGDCHDESFSGNNSSRRVYESIGLGDFGKSTLPFRVVYSDFAAENLAAFESHFGTASCRTANDMFVPVSSIMNKVVLVPFPMTGKQNVYAVSHCGFSEDDIMFF